MCSCDTGESPDFFTRASVKARKPHRCCECGQAIAIGQLYLRSSGKWDGNIDTFAQCQRCVAVIDAFHDVEGCNPPFTALFEQLDECKFELRDGGFASRVKLRLMEMRGRVSFAVQPGTGYVSWPSPYATGGTHWYRHGTEADYAVDGDGRPVVEPTDPHGYYKPVHAYWASEHYHDPRYSHVMGGR